MSGSFIHSPVATDIRTGWTDAVHLLTKEHSTVAEGMEAIARQLPFQVLGIDSDNDSAFINETSVHTVPNVNYFQSSFKLLDKMGDGAKTIKRYSPPAMPCDRLMQDDTITAQTKDELNEYRPRLDPVALLRSTREAQLALVARYPHQSLRKQLPVKAWSGFWPACPVVATGGSPAHA